MKRSGAARWLTAMTCQKTVDQLANIVNYTFKRFVVWGKIRSWQWKYEIAFFATIAQSIEFHCLKTMIRILIGIFFSFALSLQSFVFQSIGFFLFKWSESAWIPCRQSLQGIVKLTKIKSIFNLTKEKIVFNAADSNQWWKNRSN